MKHYNEQQWMNYISDAPCKREQMEEHLYHCDECLNIYIANLELCENQLPLLADEGRFVDGVMEHFAEMERIRPATQPEVMKFYQKPMFHYAAAACITLVLVTSGTFQSIYSQLSHAASVTTKTDHASISGQIMAKTATFIDSLPSSSPRGGHLHEKK